MPDWLADLARRAVNLLALPAFLPNTCLINIGLNLPVKASWQAPCPDKSPLTKPS